MKNYNKNKDEKKLKNMVIKDGEVSLEQFQSNNKNYQKDKDKQIDNILRTKDINESILLAKKALKKDPKYVDSNYRKEQLWGEKLQSSTEKLLKNNQLKKEVLFAKTKIN